MHSGKAFLLTMVLLVFGLSAYSQKLIKGIVVDSVSLDALSGVHVQVKNTNRTGITDPHGIFTILVNAKDTITFSYVGYAHASAPVHLEDEIMFVRMHDESILLKEIIIRPTFLDQKYIESPTLQSTRPLRASPNGVNFAYFSKLEKEKRKLELVMRELEQVRAYVEIVNDPAFRIEFMERYAITEARYYEILVLFNENNPEAIHSENEAIILNALNTHFRKYSGKK